MRKRQLLTTLALMLMLPVGALAAEDVVPDYTPPPIDAVKPIPLPDIHQFSLGNGLNGYVFPHSEAPTLSVRFTIPHGSLYDPLDQAGLTNFMANLLTKGTETRSAQQIASEIEYVGGSLNSGAGKNSIYASVSVLSRDGELAFELLGDVLLNPTFPEEEIQRERTARMSNLMSEKDNPGTIANKQWNQWVYGEHPYGLPNGGTVATVQAFQRDDILAQYSRLFDPSRAILAVAGDIDPAKAERLVREHFEGWQAPEAGIEELAPPADQPDRKILLIDKPDAVQSEIRMGYLLAPYNMGEDTYRYRVMNYMFGGGGFSSRLMQVIRNDMGLTYGVRSGLDRRQLRAAFEVSTNTRSPETATMIGEILNQMELAIDEGFTAQELEDAKSYMIGSYPRGFETPNQIASSYISALVYDWGDPADYLEQYRSRIAGVTLEDANRAARDYLMPEKVRITVVGNADEIRSMLEEFGEVTEISIEEL